MRRLALLTLTFGVVLGHGAGTSGRVYAAGAVDPTEPRLVRVRSESPEIAAVIRRASETSATFRRLLAIIDGSDGLVYVDKGKCGHGVHSCLVLSVQVAGPFRILHIRIEPRSPDCHLMASIGHELQHAIEVLSHPYVTSGAQAFLLFFPVGGSASMPYESRFETDEAVRAGMEVDHEACRVEGR